MGASKLIALSAEPALVADFAARLLQLPEEGETDAALREIDHGRRRALRLIEDEARG